MLAKILLGAGVLCIVFSLVPLLVYGIFHVGVPALFLLGAALVLFALFGQRLPSPWRVPACAAFVVVIGYVVVMSAMMSVQAWGSRPPEDRTVVVVVLGAKVNGNSPSLMLRHRLNAAAAYLEAHPEVVCVVSGGQGADEMYPEAQVMKAYLVARGIDSGRIFEENRSVNTRENLAFSQEIIEDIYGGEDVSIAIVTDSFHQLRAVIYGQSLGLDCSSIPAVSPWGLFPSYWMRELLGIPVAWLQTLGA